MCSCWPKTGLALSPSFPLLSKLSECSQLFVDLWLVNYTWMGYIEGERENDTFSETDTALENMASQRNPIFQPLIFRDYVSFREGIPCGLHVKSGCVWHTITPAALALFLIQTATVPYPTPKALASSAPLATAAEVAESSWRSQSWHLSDWHLWWHTAPPEHAHHGLVWSLLKCWDVALHLIMPSFSRFGFAQKVPDQFYFRIRMVAWTAATRAAVSRR